MSSVPACGKATKPFRTEAEFSLYSTDSENQVASVHQGLDRCAALLKSLLGPESNSLQQNAQELLHQAVTRRTAGKPSSHAPMKLLKGVAASSSPHRGKTCPTGSTKPSVDVKFPGALKYLHSTSTPVVKHSRSKTEPRNIAASKLLKEHQPSAHSGSAGRIQHQDAKHKSARKYITARRRLRTEPGGRNTQESGTQTEGVPPSLSIRPKNDTHGVLFRKIQHPQASKQSTGSSIAPGITASMNPSPTEPRQPSVIRSHIQVPLHGSYQPHTPAFSQHYPCYPPPTPFPYTVYHPTYTGQYGPAICNPHPFSTSASLGQTEGHSMWLDPLQSSSPLHLPQRATAVQQSLASKCPPHLRFEQGKRTTEKCTSSHVSGGGPANGASFTGGRPVSTTQANQPKSSHSTDPHSQPEPVQHSVRIPNIANRFHPFTLSTAAGASQELHLLIQEMLNTFRHTVGKIKGTVGTANSDLSKQLEGLEHSLTCYLKQITDLCQLLINQRSSGVTGHSIADWLVQVQQLEREKAHLLERVIKSEMAYSEAQALLDQTKTKLENLQEDLESQKMQVSTVIHEMQSNTEALTSLKTQKKAVEEELEAMKAENAVLQQQISFLEQEASRAAEETRLQQDQLSTAKCSLDTAQEEIQMVKLSLSEKETELLQAQDQLLGLRQCVAYFFSELVKLDSSRDSSRCTACYYVSEEAGQRLQGLVNNGSIDSFLAAYVNRTSTPVSVEDSPRESFDRTPTPQAQGANERSDQLLTFPSQLNTHQAANDSNCTCNSLPGDQAQSEKETSRSTISQLLRAPKPSSSEHNSHGMYHEPFTLRSATSSQSNVDVQSTLTTSSELEFRKDLASLDADIARLQMQFRVAEHNAPSHVY